MAASMIAFSQLNSKLTMVLASNAARRVQTALHLLSLVLESGRPNRLRELLLRCKFLRFTLHLIGSLCSLPRTVFLRPDPVISITMSAFVAFTQALWNLWSGVAFVPRSLRYHQRKNPLANVTKVYTRKRKRNATGILVLAGGDMGAIGGNCPPTIVVDTPAQTVSPKKLKQDDVQKGRSTGESYKSDGKPISTSHKKQVQLESLPALKGFIVEEILGSGGYGTVYKVIRKLDGIPLAIKCPRGNTNRHHIQRERKMLEQYGGKNFIIKYEGSFKHRSADCLVLQYFEHERPEVLKKEITLYQLQWYGYCLFRALSSLHKQGVIHRDVKPENFLFSRMANKGYLIDFNLARDMNKIYGTTASKKVLSGGRLKEPVPFQGRKELISLAGKAMHSPNQEAASPPTSKGKRNVASPRDSNIAYPTPMSLYISGVAITGKPKTKEEGPCVGTKGFKAPEVLLKSYFQGPVIDVWSAGVTLVYLTSGRSPFVGDPDQNLMGIAELRGSEDLWEVARLHDRESSFPMQLLDVKYLPSKKLCDWFGLHTKRPELLKDLPGSFFDLVDKCLTLNPRTRISAEAALKHEFFAPCHEQLKQQRQRRRQVLSSRPQSLQLNSG
ncbi:putative cell division control protein 7 homolog 1 [Apium graveolens]|uniref:putative cell division control protein 7 homolog 1 n=1 Tax=Apium graveolens TaxID=4045 RepID=UPI003D7A4FB9